jgi:hypothetical protein
MLIIPTSIPGLEQIPNAESALPSPTKVPTFLRHREWRSLVNFWQEQHHTTSQKRTSTNHKLGRTVCNFANFGPRTWFKWVFHLYRYFWLFLYSRFSFKCLFGEDVSSRSCRFGLSWGTRPAKTLIPSVDVGIQNRGLTKICWGGHLEKLSYIGYSS